jgi:hypothetical protein
MDGVNTEQPVAALLALDATRDDTPVANIVPPADGTAADVAPVAPTASTDPAPTVDLTVNDVVTGATIGGPVLLTDAEGFQMFPNDTKKILEEIERRKTLCIDSASASTSTSASASTATSKPSAPVLRKTVKKALSANLARQIKNLPDTIVIINERVQLNEENFTPVDGGNIGFSDKYFPNNIKSPSEIIKAKIIFAKVFKAGNGFNIDDPKPPCGEGDEYAILREGIENRLKSIRDEIKFNKPQEGQSVRVSGLEEQRAKLVKLLDDLDKNEGKPCGEYNDPTDSTYGLNKVSSINNTQINRLIRNFSFLVLQALNPINGYERQMEIDPVDFINILDNSNLSPALMNKFLGEYQNQQYEIPSILAGILSDTDTQKTALGVMVEQEKLKLLEEILASVSLKESLGDEFNTFKQRLGGDSSEQIISVIRWIVENIDKVKTENNKLENQRDELTGVLKALEEAPKEAEQSGGGLQDKLAEIEAKININKDNHKNLLSSLKMAESRLSPVTTGGGNSHQADRKKILTIVQKILSGKINANTINEDDILNDPEKAAFSELLTKTQPQGYHSSNKMIDDYYLNYFVKFFMRELTIEPELKTQIKTIVERKNDDIMPFIHNIFMALSSEKSGPLTPKELCSFFKDVPNISDKLISVYQNKFPNFYKMAKDINYTIKGTDGISYLTLFTYFLFFAKKYLIESAK